MEFEQLIKRLDWLDEQRRAEKTAIASLEERLHGLEGDLKIANKKIKDLNSGMTKNNVTPARLDQIETALSNHRVELSKYVDSLNEHRIEAQQESENRQQLQLDKLNRSLLELQKVKTPISELKRELKAFKEEEPRRNKIMAEWEARMQSLVQKAETVERSQHVLEEGRKLETKRLSELQGDLTAARKRLDDTREKSEIFSDGLRRVETRVNEIISSESDRRQAQITFIETQNRLQVERDRAWKEWETSLDTFKNNSTMLERRLMEWEIAQRAVKRAQEVYEDIVQKFERRINEITEMQRLAEDRFRQEWVTFKADDQKRWTSFTLSQDETHKESRLVSTKLNERITSIEDTLQSIKDVLEQSRDANEQLFQAMLSQMHEYLSASERILSPK